MTTAKQVPLAQDRARQLLERCTGLSERDGVYYSNRTQAVSYPASAILWCRELEENSFWFPHRNNCIIAMVKRHPPPEPLILDVGGGNGYVAVGLQQAGFEPVVVEPQEAAVELCRARGLRHIVCSTFQDARFEKQSVPAVGFFDVIEHIEDDVTFLTEIRDHLVPSGRVYVSVPAYGLLW